MSLGYKKEHRIKGIPSIEGGGKKGVGAGKKTRCSFVCQLTAEAPLALATSIAGERGRERIGGQAKNQLSSSEPDLKKAI